MFLKLCSSLFLLAFSFSLCAQVTIFGTDIPGLHQLDGKGVYDQILHKTVLVNNLAVLKIYPPSRAESEFAACQNCCFGPANKNPDFYEFGDEYTESEPMNTAKVYLFGPPGGSVYTELSQLKGKKIGVRRGMNYGKDFAAAQLKISMVNDLAQNIKKLEMGRIDAVIAYIPDMYLTLSDLNKPMLPHDAAKPLAIHKDALVCKGVASSFMDTFNKNLKALEASGDISKILGDSYVAP